MKAKILQLRKFYVKKRLIGSLQTEPVQQRDQGGCRKESQTGCGGQEGRLLWQSCQEYTKSTTEGTNLVYRLPAPTTCLSVTHLYTLLEWDYRAAGLSEQHDLEKMVPL